MIASWAERGTCLICAMGMRVSVRWPCASMTRTCAMRPGSGSVGSEDGMDGVAAVVVELEEEVAAGASSGGTGAAEVEMGRSG